MAKNTALENITVIPTAMLQEAGRYMTKADVEALPNWDKVKEKDKAEIIQEIKSLGAAKLMSSAGSLAIGKHLLGLYERCERYSGMFRKIAGGFGYTDRHAYRFMNTYKNATATFGNDEILKVMMIKGLDILSYDSKRPLGKYTEVVKMLPPPRNADREIANRYVEQLEQTYKERKRKIAKGEIKPRKSEVMERVERDPEFLLIKNYRSIKNDLEHIPSRQRRRWFEQLVGMCMTKQGMASAVTFSPEAIPDHFNQGPGRPAAAQEEEAVAS